MTHRWLILDLAAPLMAFGGVAIDQVGPTRDMPAASMLAGLFGNALGWQWTHWPAHQALQDRLIFAACLTEEGGIVTDSQNVQMTSKDQGWTALGAPEGRAGGSADGIHRRRRDYRADARVLVVLRLQPASDAPTLDALAEALDQPARPLYLGRKPCLPARRLFAGWAEGASALSGLIAAGAFPGARAQWPDGEGPRGDRRLDLPDLRNWRTGLHSGSRTVIDGVVPVAGP